MSIEEAITRKNWEVTIQAVDDMKLRLKMILLIMKTIMIMITTTAINVIMTIINTTTTTTITNHNKKESLHICFVANTPYSQLREFSNEIPFVLSHHSTSCAKTSIRVRGFSFR